MEEEKIKKATISVGQGSNFDLMPMQFSDDKDNDFGVVGGINGESKILVHSDGTVQKGVVQNLLDPKSPKLEMFSFVNFDDSKSFENPSSEGSKSEEKTEN